MSTKLELLKSAYTNKQTGQIQDPLIKVVVNLVESRVEDILMTQQATCEDQSTVSSANSLSRDQLNNLVLEVYNLFFIVYAHNFLPLVFAYNLLSFSWRLSQRRDAFMSG